MTSKGNTTEFSAHLSRSRMGHYLQGQMTEQEEKNVELHLLHCERCSDLMMQYTQTEAPQHGKQYQKKLKGKLKMSEATRRKRLTKTHIKIFRAAAALALLFVFSFFAVKTVMEKNTSSDSMNKAQVKEKKESEHKIQEQPDGMSKTMHESEKALALHSAPAKQEIEAPVSKETGKAKEVKKPATQPKEKPVVALKPENEKKVQTEAPKVVSAAKTVETSEETTDTDKKEMLPVQALPKVEKLDVQQPDQAPVTEQEVTDLPNAEENQSLLKE